MDPFSRRRLLRRAGTALAALGGLPLLAACGGSAAVSTTAGSASANGALTTSAAGAATSGAPSTTSAAATSTSAATSASAAANAPAGASTITFLTQTSASGQKVYDAITADYLKANAGAKVNVVLGGASALEVQQKMLLLTSANTSPDVYWTHTYITPGLATLGIPQDLTSFLAQDKSFSTADLFPSSVQDFNVLGKQYALPRETTSMILVYNKDLFAKAGVAEPTADWKWSDYVDAAKKLTSGSGATKVWGTAGWPNPPYIYPAEIRAWQEGGDIVNQDRTEYTLDQDPGVKAFQWISDLIHKDQVHAAASSVQGQTSNDLFNSGKVAMLPQINVYSFFDNAKFNWDIQHLPHDGDKITRVASAGHSMTAQSANKDAAWRYLAYLESRDAMDKYFSIGGLPVASRPVREAALANQGSKPPKNIKIGIDALDYARPERVVGNWIGIHQALSNVLAGVYGPENKDVKSVLTGVAPQINELIKAKPTATK